MTNDTNSALALLSVYDYSDEHDFDLSYEEAKARVGDFMGEDYARGFQIETVYTYPNPADPSRPYKHYENSFAMLNEEDWIEFADQFLTDQERDDKTFVFSRTSNESGRIVKVTFSH